MRRADGWASIYLTTTALAPGIRLGVYEIVGLIGAGGMGEVYRARDTRLDRTVAVKVLPQQVAADPDLKQRFEREARTVAALNHPHICRLYDIGQEGDTDFLVMECLKVGRSPSDWSKARCPWIRPSATPFRSLVYRLVIAGTLGSTRRSRPSHLHTAPERSPGWVCPR